MNHMMWLQKIYIFILTPFCGLSEKINDDLRKKLIYITVFLLYSTCYIWYSIIGMGTPLTLLSRMLQSIALIIILIFLGLEKPLKPVKWNNLVIWTWFVLGMLMFIMGFFTEQNTGYWMTGPVIALGFPCLYMIYGEKEKYEMIFDALCKAAIICSIVYFFVCLAGEFFNDETWAFNNRYNGLTTDANKIGELCLASFCCIIYYLLTVKKERFWNTSAIIALAMILAQTYLTQSRTTILAMIFVTGFYFIIVIKDAINEKRIHDILLKTAVIGIAVLIALVCTSIINKTNEYHIEQQLSAEMEKEENEFINDDAEMVETEPTKIPSTRPEYRNMLPEEGRDLNYYSSGRLDIWKIYSQGFSFLGRNSDAATPISPEINVRTAHNSLVEITYRSGYITGAIYLLLVIISGIYILRVMFRSNRKNTNGDYFMAISSIGYIIFTSLMSSFNPLTAIIFLLYAIAFPVLLDRQKIRE